ncbi:MAG TPA: DUF3710 domain-containing protein [Actinomycetales bacterium]|nr:DUF3710 domain-containing protein [Actinomycetales bacterium]
MSLFRRRKDQGARSATEQDPDDVTTDVTGADAAGDLAGDGLGSGDLDDTGVLPDVMDDRTGDAAVDGSGDGSPGSPASDASGPFDVTDAPDEPRLDLGALQLPLVQGAEIQLQVDEGSGLVTAAMVVLGDAAVQLQAFAAPRSEGIWAEVSDEIAAGISQQGGTADMSDGPFGRELLGRVPAQQPDGKVGFQPMRFVGVDGPRWLLRAVFHGRAAIEPEAAAALESLVRRVVVVRGAEPMGPRELLALRLPEGATQTVPGEEGEPATSDAPASTDDLNPFERGPEITEIR